MILESILLTHVGPFRKTACIGPLTRGLNVLAAYNEEGKSTVIRAAVRTLFDSHTSGSEEIRQLQPIGTSLTPSIAVVFQCGGQRFRIEKSFLASPRSELSQWRDQRWAPIAEGDGADDKLREILRSERPGKGATKPGHWGLFQYLWARQGEPTAWPTWEGEAGKLVRARLARIELDPTIEQLKSTLNAEYEPLFTPQGKPKLHGTLEASEAELTRLATELQALGEKQHQLEDCQARFRQLGERLTTLESEARQKRVDAENIEKQTADVERLVLQSQALQSEFKSTQNELHAVEKDISDSRATETLVAGLKTDVNRVGRDLKNVVAQETEFTKRHNESAQAREQLQTGHVKIQVELDHVIDLLKFRRAFAELKPLRDRFNDAEKRSTQVGRLEQEKAKLPTVTPQKLRQLQEIDSSVRQLKAQIEIIGISVQLTPDKVSDVEAAESGKTRKLRLESGRTETIKSGDSLRLRLSAWGTIRVRSGATELKDLQRQASELQRELGTVLTEFGTKSVAEVAGVLEACRDLDTKLREARNQFKRALGDFDDLNSLQRDINRRQGHLQSLGKSIQLTKPEQSAPVAELEAREEKLRAGLRSADDKLRHQAEQMKSLSDRLSACRDKRAELEKDQSVFAERLSNAQSQIEQIRKRYAAGLDAVKSKAQQAFAEAEARVAVVAAKLPPDADKLPERNRRAAKAAADAEEALQRTRTQKDELAGTLRALGAEGIYSRETDILESISIRRAESDAARRRGWSARLLRDLLERRKQAATRAVLTPLQEKISATFADLTADPTRRVYLDENLQIRGVGRDETELLPFELLSQGTREQLLLALRIAVADAVANGEPQLLILDDVLVNTDPVRQQRVLDLLQSAAQRLQVLILTCHPDRYRGIGTQATIELRQKGHEAEI